MEIVMLMLRLIVVAISLKNSRKETLNSLRFSLLFLLGQPLLCIFIVIFFYLCAANDSSKRKHCYGYMYLQLTAFTHVQSTISQSRDFNLCVQCPLKIS